MDKIKDFVAAMILLIIVVWLSTTMYKCGKSSVEIPIIPPSIDKYEHERDSLIKIIDTHKVKIDSLLSIKLQIINHYEIEAARFDTIDIDSITMYISKKIYNR